MISRLNAAPANVYVHLDRTLPNSLDLRIGQNLIFVRAFSGGRDKYLRSLNLPDDCFLKANDIPYGTSLPGQEEGTYIAGLALAWRCGSGRIAIEFASLETESQSTQGRSRIFLPFTISDSR